MESRGIATISLTHLPKLTKKVDPPRSVYIRFPLGRSFGHAGRNDLQHKILLDLLHRVQAYKENTPYPQLPYRWKRN